MIARTLRQFLADAEIGPCTILVAVSGGADSTALLLAFSELRADGFAIRAAHVNHHLRGAESDADEEFVRELCATLAIPLDIADGTLGAERVKESGIEAAARAIRYQRLHELRGDARFIATAHQKNDQAETVLMRLLTGAGIAGLRGIHPMRDDGVIRPLLNVTREEIDAYLRENNVTPREDRSNEDLRFLRNRVRAIVRELGTTENLANVAAQAQAQWPLLEHAIDEAERTHVDASEHETRFTSWPEDAWLRAALLQRHIRRLDPDARDFDAHRIANELETIRKLTVTKHLELTRTKDAFVLRRKPEPTPEFELELKEDVPAYIKELGKTIHLTRAPKQPATSHQQLQLPNEATSRWTIRNRRHGDRFHPLGMPTSKKLKDFLIDRKIAAEARDRVPLVVWNGEIAWIAGVEVSECFKVTASGGAIYEVWMDDDPLDPSGIQR
ncbi:MAG TPA: tRNA lysidine(34) synthetase TilS [Thermoanaerobaculia bacterium]|nr:tRNA lysidine(34) synthetase TilS [Thermoanaerobaculia bacterium]